MWLPKANVCQADMFMDFLIVGDFRAVNDPMMYSYRLLLGMNMVLRQVLDLKPDSVWTTE